MQLCPPWTFVGLQANGPLMTHQILAQSVRSFPRYEKGAHLHVRTCRCITPYTFVKLLANESLTTHQISAQSLQPFQRYGKGAHLHVRKCRCTPPMTCLICTCCLVSKYTSNLVTIGPAISELQLSGQLLTPFTRHALPPRVTPK